MHGCHGTAADVLVRALSGMYYLYCLHGVIVLSPIVQALEKLALCCRLHHASCTSDACVDNPVTVTSVGSAYLCLCCFPFVLLHPVCFVTN
jgi:hypothetical protein